MLKVDCVICTEAFTNTDAINLTACGHMFHVNCLKQWRDRSPTCPHCRNTCTERNITRVYFSFTNSDESNRSVDSLREQLINAKLALKINEQELNKVEELKEAQKKSLKKIADLEQEVHERDHRLAIYVTKCNEILKLAVQKVDKVKKENKSLKKQIMAAGIKQMESSGIAVNASTANDAIATPQQEQGQSSIAPATSLSSSLAPNSNIRSVPATVQREESEPELTADHIKISWSNGLVPRIECSNDISTGSKRADSCPESDCTAKMRRLNVNTDHDYPIRNMYSLENQENIAQLNSCSYIL
ncbi:maker136 [Drosophila busckii]|uniref:Maker136 n=1 Tax=Drosophila busckii TaxID=30019 RepID=A0A0M4EX91_DROBS|nr:E3 ubiquitin-protein ligase TRAIP isoform X2 [Drosophila busckii]ALC42582.1 maker136 [Drosophila busckii]